MFLCVYVELRKTCSNAYKSHFSFPFTPLGSLLDSEVLYVVHFSAFSHGQICISMLKHLSRKTDI